jgi:maltose/moltooligosaccharide transporter
MATAAHQPPGAPAQNKPRLRFWQIFNMSVGFLGIQFGFALQNGNASRILQVFGADVEHLSWFWLVAPLTGMIVQPIIGHYSDRTWNRLGRRRPYFLAGALLAAVGLILMPNAGMFTAILPALWVGAGMLMIMDASFNIAMEPFRALVADKLPDEQRTLGYSVQTGLIGVGAVIGSWLPYILANWFGVQEVAEEGQVPANVIWSFVAGAVVLVAAIVWTIVSTKEYPPEEQRRYAGEPPVDVHAKKGLGQIFRDFVRMPRTMKQLGLVQFFSWFALFSMWVYSTPGITRSKYDMYVSEPQFRELQKIANTLSYTNGEEQRKLEETKEYLDQPIERLREGGNRIFIEANIASYFLRDRLGISEKTLAAEFYQGLKQYPFQNKEYKSALSELEELNKNLADDNPKNDGSISYPTFDYAMRYSMVAPPDAEATRRMGLMASMKRVVYEYNKGANWVGILFGIYNGVSAIFAFFLPLMARRLGRKMTHGIALALGGIGLLSVFFIQDPAYLVVSMLGIGIAWASILAMPYVILSASIPAAKMGIYMGIFNFFITLPQIVNGIFLGPIVKHIFQNDSIYSLVMAGVLMLLAALSVVFVYDPADPSSKEKNIITHNEVL